MVGFPPEQAFWQEQRDQLRIPRIAPITDLVSSLRQQTAQDVPCVAPIYGGTEARLLMVLTSPGRATRPGPGGTGFLCIENPDRAAATVKNLRPPGRVHATYWWIVEDGAYLGAITLRHGLNDFLLRAGGHVGYGIRPSARDRGLAAWVLPEARPLGLSKVLVTCDDSNLASARVIEKSGGVLEDVRDTELGRTRRYWITL
jgi:hypothetical protein